MPSRKKNINDKSRPFTTINLKIPFRISICGTNEMRNKWNSFFNKTKLPKDVFIWENIIKDLEDDPDFFNSIEFRRYDKQKLESILIQLGYPNIQTYIDFILDRAIGEKLDEKKN